MGESHRFLSFLCAGGAILVSAGALLKHRGQKSTQLRYRNVATFDVRAPDSVLCVAANVANLAEFYL